MPGRKMRLRAERAFARGAPMASVRTHILEATNTNAEPPSRRTIQRWHHERRWAPATTPGYEGGTVTGGAELKSR
jgi:hypothetical protein